MNKEDTCLEIQNQINIEEELDISSILWPDSESAQDLSGESGFFCFHSTPPFNRAPEFYSSKTERIALTRPNKRTSKKALQRRMRIIIFIDIILFMVIMGAIYPALRKIQTSGRIYNYRFHISLGPPKSDLQAKPAALDVIVKVERTANFTEDADSRGIFWAQFGHNGKIFSKEQRMLPDAPVSYFVFSVPSRQLLRRAAKNAKYIKRHQSLDVHIKVGKIQKKFYLPIVVET